MGEEQSAVPVVRVKQDGGSETGCILHREPIFLPFEEALMDTLNWLAMFVYTALWVGDL